MRYSDARAYLTERERFGIKLGLENIDRIARALGHPERSYRSILIAGTNGKGSTAALLASIVQAAGYRTGRYTSPHLVRLEERMAVDGKLIEREELASVVGALAPLIARLRADGELSVEPTFFEVVTACAFEFFRRRAVEVAILEVGMGGRWDATNVVPASVSVVTNVAFDHQVYLGDTLAAIAAEKAAIIKPGRPAVVGSLEPEALAVVRAEVARRGAPLFEVSREVRVEAVETEGGAQRVRLETPRATYEDLLLPLPGEHQLENLALAVRTAEVAAECADLTVSETAIASGVAATRWGARLELVPGRPEILIDAAHNPAGAAALARYLSAHPRSPRVLLFGVLEDKDAEGILRQLFPHVRSVVVTRPPSERARDPRSVLAWIEERGSIAAECVPSPEAALARARESAGPEGQVLVAGSIFLAGAIMGLLQSSTP